jgi:hypothetical protein
VWCAFISPQGGRQDIATGVNPWRVVRRNAEPAKRAIEGTELAAAARFTGLKYYSPCLATADAPGFMPSPALPVLRQHRSFTTLPKKNVTVKS